LVRYRRNLILEITLNLLVVAKNEASEAQSQNQTKYQRLTKVDFDDFFARPAGLAPLENITETLHSRVWMVARVGTCVPPPKANLGPWRIGDLRSNRHSRTSGLAAW
jgi:hypothetical protein